MSLPARDLAPCHQSPESFSGITTLPGLSEMRGQSTLRRDSLSWSVPFSGKPTNRQSDWRTLARLPGLIVVCFGRFWVRGLPVPNARHLGHPFQWKTTLPWHLGPAAKVRILRFKDLSPFRHYRGLQNHV